MKKTALVLFMAMAASVALSSQTKPQPFKSGLAKGYSLPAASIDPAKALPEEKAILIVHESQDTTTLPAAILANSPLAPLSLSQTLRQDKAQGRIVFGCREFFWRYWAYSIDLSTRVATRQAFAWGSTIGLEQGYRTCRAAYDSYMAGLVPLQLIVTYREAEDPGALERQAYGGNTIPKKTRRPGIEWEAICLDPPLSFQMLRGEQGGGDKTSPPGATPLLVRSYHQKLVIRPESSTEALLASLRSEYLYAGGYSIIDGRDKEGYDREGYDREGYDRYGWSGRIRYAARLASVLAGSPAELGGLKKDDVIIAVNNAFPSPARGLSTLVDGRKPGERIGLYVSSGGREPRFLEIALATQPGQAAKAYLGAEATYELIGLTEAENRKGERWSGSLAKGRQGFGLVSRPDGSSYTGYFHDDRPEGTGVSLPASGNPLVQSWTAGSLIASRPIAGKLLSPSKEWIYLGEASRDGLAEGKGGAVSPDGRYRVEEGIFIQGRLVSGTLVTPDGSRLSGLFADGKLVSGTIAAQTAVSIQAPSSGACPRAGEA